MAWRPLLEGAIAGRARAAVIEVAKAIAARTTRFSDLDAREGCLDSGPAGAAVLFGELARAGVYQPAREQADRFLQAAFDAVQAFELPPALWRGFVGAAWTAEHISQLGLDDEDACAEIDELLVATLARPPDELQHGLLVGAAGIGVYALARLPRPLARDLLGHVVRRIATTAIEHEAGRTWYLPAGADGCDAALFPAGAYPLGLARGAPACIAILGAACARGIAVEEAAPVLDAAVRWMLAQRRRVDGSDEEFPAYVAVDAPAYPARAGWCFSDIGIAMALLIAGRGRGVERWVDEAMAIARRAGRLSIHPDVSDTALCHGSAGLGHMFNRLYQTTGEQAFAETARTWFVRTLEMRVEGPYTGGFPRFNPVHEPHWLDEPGLLYGASGVALALLAAISDFEPRWDAPLLVDADALAPHS